MMNDKLFNIFDRKRFVSGKKSGGSAVVSVEVEDKTPITKLLANLGEPTQDLHGYASPWPGGGGKNKINKSDGIVSSSRFMAFGVSSYSDTIPDGSLTLPAGEYTFSLSGDNSTNAESMAVFGADGTRIKIVYNNKILSFTNPAEQALKLSVTISSGNFSTWDNYDMQLEAGSAPTAWVPYANICPISGRTGLTVYVSPTQDVADATTYTVDWTSAVGTVYCGTLDVATGVITATMANIASYDGEEIGEPWLSSMDSYSSGATPTTGAQVVYTLEAPQEYHIAAKRMNLMEGTNYVWLSDSLLIDEFEYYQLPDSGLICDAYIDGNSLQEDGWYLKWRKLAAPAPKLDMDSIPGKDGSIDQTEALGDVFYEDRSLYLDMVYAGEGSEWASAYTDLLDAVHGQNCSVQFTDDPMWYYQGRLVAGEYDKKTRTLTMSGTMFPYKLYIFEDVYEESVSGLTEQTAKEIELEGSRMRVTPKVSVTGSITLKWGSNTKTLSTGTYYVRGLKVGKDGVTIKVWGTGSVSISYRKGHL